MKANPWITYRTRFLVKAKQLNSNLTFTDVLGRRHSGCKGDYLVESTEGVLSIAPRQIFEDIYVPLLADTEQPENATSPLKATPISRLQAFPQAHEMLRSRKPVRHSPPSTAAFSLRPQTPQSLVAARTTAS